MTTSEVAKKLGFSESAVLLWVKKGLLRVRVTPGGHRRYRLMDVDAFALKLQCGDFKPERDVVFSHQPGSKKLTILEKKPGIKPAKQASKKHGKRT